MDDIVLVSKSRLEAMIREYRSGTDGYFDPGADYWGQAERERAYTDVVDDLTHLMNDAVQATVLGVAHPMKDPPDQSHWVELGDSVIEVGEPGSFQIMVVKQEEKK